MSIRFCRVLREERWKLNYRTRRLDLPPHTRQTSPLTSILQLVADTHTHTVDVFLGQYRRRV